MERKTPAGLIGRALVGAAVAALIGISLVNIAGFASPRIMNVVRPITPRSLAIEPGYFQLHDVPVNQEVAMSVTIRNRAGRTLHLADPDADCGCVEPTLSQSVLAPGGAAELSFRYRISGTPGPIARKIVLRTIESPDQAWQVSIKGRATAKVWSEPSSIKAEIKPGETASETVMLYHIKEVTVGRIASDNPSIRITQGPDGPAGRRMAVAIVPDPKDKNRGAGSIQVFGDTPGAPIFEIPVSWTSPTKFRLVPPSLILTDFSPPAAGIEKTVAVLLGPDADAGNLAVEPLVPWLRVIDRRVVSQSILVRVRFDPAAMPEVIDQGVLSVGLRGEEPPVLLKAVGRRSHAPKVTLR